MSDDRLRRERRRGIGVTSAVTVMAALVSWMNAGVAEATPVTTVAAEIPSLYAAFNAEAAPDGARVMIRGWTYPGANPGLWSVDTATGASTRVTPPSQFVGAQAQSPDGHLVAWESGERMTHVFVRDLATGATRTVTFPRRRFHDPDVEAIAVAADGGLAVLVGSHAGGGPTDGAVLHAPPGGSRLTPVLPRALRGTKPGLQSVADATSPDGRVFSVCRSTITRTGFGKAVLTVAGALDVVRGAAATVHRPPGSCVAGDDGAGAMSYSVSTRGHYAAIVVGRGRARRVRLGTYGNLLAVRDRGRSVLASNMRGTRIATIRPGRRPTSFPVPKRVRDAVSGSSVPGDPYTWSADGRQLTVDSFPRSDSATVVDTWLLDLGTGRWRRAFRKTDATLAPNECFLATGRLLLSVDSNDPIEDADFLYVSDTARRTLSRVSSPGALSPFFATTQCSGVGPDRLVYFVGGSPIGVYAAPASAVDDQPLEVSR